MAVTPPEHTAEGGAPPDEPASADDPAGPGVSVVPGGAGRRSGPAGAPITSFTAVCRVRPGEGDALATVLERLLPGPNSPLEHPTTHYARLQVIDQVVGRRLRRRPLADAVLVLSADVDGSPDDWLGEVLRLDAVTWARILSYCVDAPGDPTAVDFVRRSRDFLLDHRVPVALHYVNDPGRSAGEVRRAVRRHRALAGFALGHRHSTPAARRAAFLKAFPRAGGSAGPKGPGPATGAPVGGGSTGPAAGAQPGAGAPGAGGRP